MWSPALRPPLLLGGSTALALLLVTGCGGGTTSAPATGVPSVTAPSTAAPDAAPPASAPAASDGRGTLAEDPVFTDELDTVPAGWPEPPVSVPGSYPLAVGQSVPLPYEQPPEALGALVTVGVTLPATGAATLTCDLGATGTVSLELTAEGGWTVRQTTSDGPTELDSGTLDPGQRGEPGEPTALRLACSAAPGGLGIVTSLHGAGLSPVDAATNEAPAQDPTWTISSSGEADITVDTMIVLLVEP